MLTRYAQLSPLALAAGFGVAALAGVILFCAPMAFSMFGMHGYGMMGGAGYGMMGGPGNYRMGAGVAFFMGGWAVVVSAIAGAIVAAIYNSLLPKRSTPHD
jgi:hypothetical protein